MRIAAALALAALLATPSAVAGPLCVPFFILGHACASVGAGADAVGVDLFALYTPLILPREWRSAHAVVGANGAGAAVHGSGFSTGGSADVWLSVTTAGQPQADTYTCFSYPPYAPAACKTTMQRVSGLLPLIPTAPAVPLLP